MTTKRIPTLQDWVKEGWTVGQYEPTETFKEIKNHSCVCKPDKSLIVLTGPAEDVESQRLADLFAAAPELLKFIKRFDDDNYCDADQINNDHSEDCVACEARRLIAKAEGKKE